MTEKNDDQRSVFRRVFPSKNALQTKRPVFYSPGAFTGEEVAEHLNYLMHKHEAPLFLKRDNGSNLNSGEVLSILKMFAVIPFNSPPGFPQFNGVMERSQGEILLWENADADIPGFPTTCKRENVAV